MKKITVTKFSDERGMVVQQAVGPIGTMEQQEIAGYDQWLKTVAGTQAQDASYTEAYRRWITGDEKLFERYAKPRLFRKNGETWRYSKLSGYRNGKKTDVWFRDFCYFDYSLWLKDNPGWISEHEAETNRRREAKFNASRGPRGKKSRQWG